MKFSFYIYIILLIVVIHFSCDLEEIPDSGPFECGQTFTDPRDGKTYKTVWIANDGSHDLNKPGQCWMAENLEFLTSNFTSNCYAAQATKCDTFGRMYGELPLNNVCMNGWHIATAAEWSALFKTYGMTELLTGNGPNYSGNNAPFLPGGTSKLDFLMGGSCLSEDDCDGAGTSIGFWAGGKSNFTFFNKSGGAQVWSTAVIQGATDLRYYVRCVKN